MIERRKLIAVFSVAASILVGCAEHQVPLEEPEKGLVVEQVRRNSAAERLGLLSGDLLLTWSRQGSEPVSLRHPMDLRLLKYEQASRSPVEILLQRRGKPVRLVFGATAWDFDARPRLPSLLEPLYEQARQAATEGNGDLAGELSRQAAERTEDPGLALFFFGRAATLAVGVKDWTMADSAFAEARRQARDQGRLDWEALLVLEQVDAWRLQGDREKTEASLSEVAESLAPRPDLQLLRARVLDRRGELKSRDGRLNEAEKDMRKALEIRKRETPEGLWVGRGLANLATVYLWRGQLEEAEQYIRHAIEIEEEEGPDSISVGASYSNLAFIAHHQGELKTAEALLMRYAEILDQRGGDALRRASIAENRAVLRARLGDLEGTVDLLEEAIELKASAATGQTVEMTLSLTSLAEVQRLQGALEEAEATAQRSLRILERVAPDGIRMAAILGCLGNIARSRGDLDLAMEYFSEARSILLRESPFGVYMSLVLAYQAAVQLEQGELGDAESLVRLAIENDVRRASFSEESVRSRRLLGQIRVAQGELGRAAAEYSRVLDDLDALARLRGRSDLRQILFWRKASFFYAEALEIEARLGRPERAYAILERSRARSLLRLLADRGLEEQPPELAAEMRRLGRDYEARQAELAASEEVAEVERLAGELRSLRREREDLWERATSSGRWSGLVLPFDASEAEQALDPGTRLLAYSVGRDQTVLLTLARGEEPKTVLLPVGSERLEHLVAQFRSDLEAGRRGTGATGIRLRRAMRHAARLYDLLIRAVEPEVAKAERLVLMPDGALHDLPFSALRTPTPSGERIYLVERLPLHMALSMTHLAALRQENADRRSAALQGRHRLVAFGDPRYPVETNRRASAGVLRHGTNLHPLPGSRREVSAITALFPGSRAFLGEEATEEALRNIRDVDILHLACHGLVDSRSPLDSAVALTPAEGEMIGQENGLLQAWEILQDLRFDAQLVVLSACSSASGEPMGGEGVVGLARAFQGAGARSVLAPLWNIWDELTPELMERFYQELQSGKAKDEALRIAQLSILRPHDSTNPRPPYFWAAFQLYGDHL